jgi:hypothetical protein
MKLRKSSYPLALVPLMIFTFISANAKSAFAFESKRLSVTFALTPEKAQVKKDFPVYVAGQIEIRIKWRPLASHLQVSLRRPDDSIAARQDKTQSEINIRYRASESEVKSFLANRHFLWTLEISLAAGTQETVTGEVSIAYPSGTVDILSTQLRLQRSQKSVEKTLTLPVAGKVTVTAFLDPNATIGLALTSPDKSKTNSVFTGNPRRVELPASAYSVSPTSKWQIRLFWSAFAGSESPPPEVNITVKVVVTPD